MIFFLSVILWNCVVRVTFSEVPQDDCAITLSSEPFALLVSYIPQALAAGIIALVFCARKQ